ncbi:hypothetical protein CN090_04355 [Sinorhizobium meliloti]|uniref:hypothetical protein n=1 Tax=Rhizobium meliloti TaxID=382 RepID=UPI000FD85F07|nr:hypothetical protein [Sinorhizobium meliloti]RVO55154.1 hypothetical protein CN090_04355 [Sinorhizobium meliloti]
MTRKPANDTTRRQRALAGEGDDLPARMSYTEVERDGVHVQKARLARMAKKGADWDGTAANDNIAWPLATALIKEGNSELLKYAMYYRKVHDTAKSNAQLGGTSVRLGDGVALDRYSVLRPDGKIAYRRPRKSTAANVDIPARRRFDASTAEDGDEPQKNWSSIPKPWNGDRPVNDKMDAERHLARLQSALGHLCEPFELACIDGRTLAEVGNAAGIANRSGAQGAGRVLVHTALITLRDFIGDVRREDLVA